MCIYIYHTYIHMISYVYYERYFLAVLLVLELLFHLTGALLESRQEGCVSVQTWLEGCLLNSVGRLLGSQQVFSKFMTLVVPAKAMKQTLGSVL